MLIDVLVFLGLGCPLANLDLIALRMVVTFNLVLRRDMLNLYQVLLGQGLNLHGVALVDLRRHLVANVLVQVLDLLEHAPLQLGSCAVALSELIVTVMVDADFGARFRPQFLDDLKFLLKHDLQIFKLNHQISVRILNFRLH